MQNDIILFGHILQVRYSHITFTPFLNISPKLNKLVKYFVSIFDMVSLANFIFFYKIIASFCQAFLPLTSSYLLSIYSLATTL